MRFVNASGVRLYVEETGAGYPVVFVHELSSDYREWEAQVRFFSRLYRCVTFNARGYPPSDVPSDPNLYGYEFAADDIAAVMRGLGIPKAHIVGLSMGAYAALHLGLRHPEMASAIVAAGVGSGSLPAEREAFMLQMQATAKAYLEHGAEAMADVVAQSPTRVQFLRKDPRGFEEFLRHLKEHSARGMSNTIARYQGMRPSLQDFRAEFAKMQIPALMMVGDEDEPCLETSLFLKKTIPGAGLWIWPHTGHAINLEEPAAFNQMVLDFFGAVGRGRWGR